MPNATLKDIPLKSQYRTNPLNRGSVVGSFYIPVLETAVRYDRLSGFFSSTSLALAAKGIAALIANGGHMRLICSPRLSPDDVETMERFVNGNHSLVSYESNLQQEFHPTENRIEHDHLAALGWMLENGFLEIMLAVIVEPNGRISPNPIFHPKVGLITDHMGNEISFSGSNNETVSGWADNQEEFKVFKSWIEGQDEYYQNDRNDFERYWRNEVEGVLAFNLPLAFRKKLVCASRDFDREKFLAKYYVQERKRAAVWTALNLRDYQESAIAEWEKSRYSMLFEMATGSGKTRTAIGCINLVMEHEKCGCVVVAAPRIALCDQWRREMKDRLCESSVMIVANSDCPTWREKLAITLSRMALGTNPFKWVVVFASHATASSKDFLELISTVRPSLARVLIADETHALGAPELKRALMPGYQYRVGLSATPERMFDEVGSKCIADYFGNHKYSFTLGDAIAKQRVCSYRYYPIIVALTDEERDRYELLTDRISKLSKILEHEYDSDVQARLERTLRARADLVTAASGKIPRLKELLKKNGNIFERNVIVFACPQNIEDVIRAFTDEMKTTRRFTYFESDPLVRREILAQFASGGCSALVAMKCLDEGIDIPTAQTAVLVSSTTNPREYIQRIGRVLRLSPGKSFARIYDFLVALDKKGKDIPERELKRALYVAEYAENASEAFDVLFDRKGA